MAVEAMLTDDYDPDYQMPDGPAPGKYHAVVIRLEEDGGKKGEMVVDYEILAGTTKDQEGKVHRDYFQKTAKAMGRIHQLAMACGMVTAEQLKDMKARGQSPVYEFERDAIGKHIHVDLYSDEYNGQTRTKCGFGIYHISDPKCSKGWPKNTGMLAKAGIAVAAPPANATPQNQTAAPATAASPVDGLLDGVV